MNWPSAKYPFSSMRNGQITVKGSWVRPLNCLETNMGRIYVANADSWYSNPESFWVLEKDGMTCGTLYDVSIVYKSLIGLIGPSDDLMSLDD